jgi:hypothetical protein
MGVLRNRRAATFAAIAFLLGTLVFPALHLAFHELPHHHHDGGAGHHHHHDDGDRDHGKGSLAHFAVAIGSELASAVELPMFGLTPVAVVATHDDHHPASAHVAVARFRGPPRA